MRRVVVGERVDHLRLAASSCSAPRRSAATPAPSRATRDDVRGVERAGADARAVAGTALHRTPRDAVRHHDAGREAVRDPGHRASLGRMAEPMTRPVKVPAARQALAVLGPLARQPGAGARGRRWPASSGCPARPSYHLLASWRTPASSCTCPRSAGTGSGVAALELGTAYLRQEPLARLARRCARPARRPGRAQSAHLAVLHGREVLYVVEERAPGRPSLVTDVGVRLPAQLTASGRAMLAALPAAQVRALFPDAGRVRRPARRRAAHRSRRCAGCSPTSAAPATRSRTAR